MIHISESMVLHVVATMYSFIQNKAVHNFIIFPMKKIIVKPVFFSLLNIAIHMSGYLALLIIHSFIQNEAVHDGFGLLSCLSNENKNGF